MTPSSTAFAIAFILLVVGLPCALALWAALRFLRPRAAIPMVERVRTAREIEALLRAQPDPPRAVVPLSDPAVGRRLIARALADGRLADVPYTLKRGRVCVLPGGTPELLVVVDGATGAALVALRRLDA